MSKLVSVLLESGKIDADTASRVEKFIADNNTFKPTSGDDGAKSLTVKRKAGEGSTETNGKHEEVPAKKSKKVRCYGV